MFDNSQLVRATPTDSLSKTPTVHKGPAWSRSPPPMFEALTCMAFQGVNSWVWRLPSQPVFSRHRPFNWYVLEHSHYHCVPTFLWLKLSQDWSTVISTGSIKLWVLILRNCLCYPHVLGSSIKQAFEGKDSRLEPASFCWKKKNIDWQDGPTTASTNPILMTLTNTYTDLLL